MLTDCGSNGDGADGCRYYSSADIEADGLRRMVMQILPLTSYTGTALEDAISNAL